MESLHVYICVCFAVKSVHAFCPFKHLECLFLLLGDLQSVHTRVCVLTWATLLCVPGPAANITTLPAWRSLLRTPGVRARSWVPHTPHLGGVLCFFFLFFLQTSNCLLRSSSGVQSPSPRLNTPPSCLGPAPSWRRLRPCSQSRAGSAWSLLVLLSLFSHHGLPVLIYPLLC